MCTSAGNQTNTGTQHRYNNTPPSLIQVLILAAFLWFEKQHASPAAFRLASHAGVDWHPCCTRTHSAALLPREPQVHADPERRWEDGQERQGNTSTHLIHSLGATCLTPCGVVCLPLGPAALRRLRGWDNVEAEVTEMRLEEHSERAEGRLSVLSLLSQRSLRWQLVSIIVMNMGQQLSGVNAVSPSPSLCSPSSFLSNPSKWSDYLSIFSFIYCSFKTFLIHFLLAVSI